MQNTHISKVIALFASTTVWQSGGDAPYCKTAITACCQSCHLAGELHAFYSYLSSFLLLSSTVCHHLSLSLLPPPCLVLSLLVFLAPVNIFYLLLSSPLLSVILILHLYLPVHPPPSRPGSRTETRGSVKIERGMKERKEWGGHNVMISPFLSFCLPPVAVTFAPLFVCVSSPFVALSPALLSYATNEISTHLTNTCVRTHTHRVHANTNTHTQCTHWRFSFFFLWL